MTRSINEVQDVVRDNDDKASSAHLEQTPIHEVARHIEEAAHTDKPVPFQEGADVIQRDRVAERRLVWKVSFIRNTLNAA